MIGYFGLSTLKTPRLTRQLDRTQPYPHVASRSLLTRTGSGTADVMSVAFVAAEVTGDRVALRVTSACDTRVNSGDEIWTAKSAFFVRNQASTFGSALSAIGWSPRVRIQIRPYGILHRARTFRGSQVRFGYNSAGISIFLPCGTDSPIMFLGYAGLQGLLN